MTKQMQAEVALQKKEKLLATAERIANIGSWERDLITGVTTWSEQLYQVYGRDRKLGVPSTDDHLEIHHPDDRELLQQALDNTLKNGKPYTVDFRIFRYHDHELRWLHAEAQVEKNKAGKPIRLISIVQDITERKKLEELLEKTGNE